MRSRINIASAGLVAMVAAISCLSTASAQFPSNDTACTRYYTVQPGDTCDKIGQKTMTSTYQIMALNLPQSGPSCYQLEEGEKLCLGTYGNDCQLVHHAHSQDTCESIAQQYGISVKRLRENNPSMDCGQIYSGLMLCTVEGLVRPVPDPRLPLQYAAPQRGQMDMGVAITAKNPTPLSTPSAASTQPASAKEQIARHFKHNARKFSH